VKKGLDWYLLMAFSLSTENIAAILLDIEGTTTPISFVYDVLFPFARTNARNYLEKHFGSGEVQQDLELLRHEHAADASHELSVPPLISGSRTEEIESFVAYVRWLMERDRKSTGLKSLQGKIWEQGYRDLILRAEVFDDVAGALNRWRDAGRKIAIFSSGSVLAQMLLFAHSDKGNLSTFVDHYFDTTIGPKTSPESYRNISGALGLDIAETLFVSDVTSELEAARAAGMRTLLCVRPGNHSQPSSHQHSIIQSFDEIAE
jgi:enolase-phosphatase E1